MSILINPQAVLLSLGIIQPATPSDTAEFLSTSLLKNTQPISASELAPLFDRWLSDGFVVKVHVKENLFSLTSKANHSLSKDMRHLRDKTRLFLLKELRNGTLQPLRGSRSELADVSSARTNDSDTQEEQRPISATAVTLRQAQIPGRSAYWPLLVKQLFVGSSPQPLSPIFRYGSFYSLRSCHSAHPNGAEGNDFNLSDLALCIGISPRLLSSFAFHSDHHYRLFEIPKKSGGVRNIKAPRTMLKITQHWVLDHLLHKLPLHSACMSYQKGISIYDNAAQHCNQSYVGNFDIKDFFPSITTKNLKDHFTKSGFGEQSSQVLARLLTVDNQLPQGAPTSPVVSNSYLFEFDKKMTVLLKTKGINYSRYADDVTLSGSNRKVIQESIALASTLLEEHQLTINPEKTRISGQGNRQTVTGLVVNKIAQPPRSYRRKVRAMFNNASKNPKEFKSKINELAGHLSYLSSFQNINETSALNAYQDILNTLRNDGFSTSTI